MRRSLGWIPFKVRTIRYRGGQVYFAGRWLSLWDSFGLSDFELRAGNLSEGFELASASVREGRAAAALERLIEVSNS